MGTDTEKYVDQGVFAAPVFNRLIVPAVDTPGFHLDAQRIIGATVVSGVELPEVLLPTVDLKPVHLARVDIVV